MPEEVAKHFVFPNFTPPVTATLREILDNNNTTRDNSYPNGLNDTKGESRGVSMMLKTGMEAPQYYTVFNYGTHRQYKYLNPQDRTILARPGIKPSPTCFLPGNSKEKVGEETPPKCVNHG